MQATALRHRPLVLLAAVVLAQVLLLAVQIKREQEVRLIRVWAVWLLTPLQRAGAYTIDHVAGVWGSYVGLRNARNENQQLRAELDQLKLRVVQLESRAAEAGRLAVLLEFRETYPDVPMLAARVISASAVVASKTVYINRGERHGVERNMGVITPSGVVGKVLEVFADTAHVLLLTDRESGVGALLGSTRTQGVIRGTSEPVVLLQYVVSDETVNPGDAVLTSGQDQIFPKDLPVGTVVEVQPGNPFKLIRVRPAARLDRLEEVIVLLTRQELKPATEAAASRTGKSPRVIHEPAARANP
jgi:rod shape-determining protein MreC